MAPTGVEPVARGLGNRCSIRLSYGAERLAQWWIACSYATDLWHFLGRSRVAVESKRSAVTYRTGGADCDPPLSEPASPSGPSSRFHVPLIEPDLRISRIRLSDKVSRGRPRKSLRAWRQLDESQRLIQVLDRDPGGHLKIPHLWPGQTPPPGRRRNGNRDVPRFFSWCLRRSQWRSRSRV